jgi:hypothetical protein
LVQKHVLDPVTSNLDNKIKKIDLDNKRLQLELELLQDKYQNLNNGIFCFGFVCIKLLLRIDLLFK